MSARKSKYARSSQEDRNRFGGRNSNFRKPLAVICVVLDDTTTAASYFDLIKSEIKDVVTLRVVPAPDHGATPSQIVEYAKQMLNSIVDDNESTPKDCTLVWALIDAESDPKQLNRVKELQSACTCDELDVIISYPCYEVWTLLHLVDTGSYLENCTQARRQVAIEWGKTFSEEYGVKSQADYSKICHNRNIAAERARRQHKSDAQCWTEIYRVIEGINKIVELMRSTK